MIAVIVPVKDFGTAKSRLSDVLSPEERAGLARAMLADVLAAVEGSSRINALYLVGHDAALIDIAAGRAGIIPETANRGYNEAIATACELLTVQSADALLALPSDLPLATSAEIDQLAAAFAAPIVRIAQARDQDGTNGLLIAPPDAIRTGFGPYSAARHGELARAAGCMVETLSPPGLAFDIDTPQDLLEFCRIDAGTRAHSFLDQSGIRRRLLG